MNDPQRDYRFRTVAFCIFFVSILVSCNETAPGKKHIYSLVAEFESADQTPSTRRNRGTFVLVQQNENSQKAELAQVRPGEIRYYTKVYNSPVLQYSFPQQDPVDASIEVERDYPARLRRNFQVLSGTTRIPLNEFENSVIQVSLMAGLRGDSLNELDWGHPFIESIRSTPVDHTGMEAFRKRNRERNVLFIVFDALNPFHLGCYGYDRQASPNIDSIGEEGMIWEDAVAAATYTHASTGSLLTGLYPDAFTSVVINGLIPPEFQTISESFREAGFRTALFTANPNASPLQEHDREFDALWNFNRNRDSLGSEAVMAEEFLEPFGEWMDELRSQQFFCYIHFREPHTPYSPPREYRARFLSDPDVALPQGDAIYSATLQERPLIAAAYKANLAYADAQLGKLIEILKSKGLYEKTILVFFSDHGEALWEHGHYGHFWPLYEEVTRIPLIMRFPDEPKLRKVRKQDVMNTIDLFPTFADLFGFSRKGTRFHGKSLLPILAGESSVPDRILFTRTDKRTYAVRTPEFKYIHDLDKGTTGDEMYHLRIDPGETVNIIDEHPITATYLRVYLEKAIVQIEKDRIQWKAPPSPQEPDEETKKQLKALGYTD